jgi:hypothetical protein
MSDLLKYYSADSEAAKDLMSRRVKALHNMHATATALAQVCANFVCRGV